MTLDAVGQIDRVKVVFYPVFPDSRVLSEYVYRASWYLSALKDHIQSIEFFLAEEITLEDLPQPAPELAPDLAEIAGRFSAIKLRQAESEEFLQALRGADFIFVFDEASRSKLDNFGSIEELPTVVRVDKDFVQFADSFLLRFSDNFPELRSRYQELALKRAKRLLPALTSDRCYLFGTGPNLSDIRGHQFDDGLTIACNSMAINAEMLLQIKPDLFVIADPIFHAGPSAYAHSFRAALVEQLRRRPCPLIVPMRDYHIYVAYLPKDIQSRIIPIEFLDRDKPILDVIAEAKVTTTSNILTLFQIPLAATLASEIYISGCDGRPVTSNDYFWMHNKSVQINEKMDSIKKAHPAFFDISYAEYYLKHIETLARWVEACEAKGCSVSNLTPSYIPALQSRQSSMLLKSLADSRPLAPTVSVVIPSYNSRKFLNQAVRSLLDEKRADLEIIIVDDFSDDGSYEVAAELGESFDNVFVCQNYARKGVSGARNTGLALARGAYVAFLDADDLIYPSSLNARVNYLEANPKASVVHSRCMLVNERSEELGVNIGLARNITFKDMFGSSAHFNTVMIRSDAVGDQLHFDENLKNGEDWLALARLLRRGLVSHYVADGAAAYRVHPSSTVLKNVAGHEKALTRVIDEVYSRDESGTAAREFIEGLSSPTRADVIYGRALSSLVFCILNGDVEALKKYLGNEEFRIRLAGDDRDFYPMLKVPAVRFSAMPIDRQAEIPEELLNSVKAGIEAAEEFPDARRLLDCIRELFRLSSTASSAHSSPPAPALTSEWAPAAASRRSSPVARAPSRSLVGPFARGQAHLDETRCIWQLFNVSLSGSLMIDVGAHFGSSLLPFLNKGWTVFAFEPDEKNRARLLERVENHGHRGRLNVDIRCIGNESQSGVSFFTSEVSTGISGLSAFDESHEESQSVDITTLTLFFKNRKLPPVDFLKIDTEGHDLFVLQGYPWDRRRPAVIECEFEDHKTKPLGYTFHELGQYLTDKGYTVYVSEWHPIVRYGIPHDWRQLVKYPCELASSNGWGNLLAFREPIDESALTAAMFKVMTINLKYEDPAAQEGVSLSFAEANRLTRQGKYGEALPLYLRLCKKSPLSVYSSGALYAARRLGLKVSTIEELMPLKL